MFNVETWPQALELRAFKRRVEVETSYDSRIRDPRLESLRFELTRTDRTRGILMQVDMYLI